MASLSPAPKLQFFGTDGLPLVGGKLYIYAAGTTPPIATYTDNIQAIQSDIDAAPGVTELKVIVDSLV